MNYIHTFPLIKSCSFISCVSGGDGCGCGIRNSHSSTTYAGDSCRFIKCKGIKDSDSEGGGIMFYLNKNFVTCTNCLFYTCNDPKTGGGMSIYPSSDTPMKPINFCYFRENKSKGARDIYFSQSDSTIQAIIHSFSSESSSGKVVGGSDNWLLQKHTNTTLTAAIK